MMCTWWSPLVLLLVAGVAAGQPPAEVTPAAGVLPPLPPVKVPPLPPIKPPTPPAAGPVTPAVPLPPLPSATPVPALPPLPAVPPPAGFAPPAPPAKSAPPAQPAPPPGPDSRLRPADGGNTFKTDAPPAFVPVPPRPVAPPAVPAVRPADPAPAPRPVLTRAADEPAPPAPTPGATAMTPALTAVLGAALALAPAAPQDKKDLTPEQRMQAIEKTLARLVEAVEGRKDSDGTPHPVDRGTVADLKALKDEVAALKKQVAEMKTTVALRPPADPMAGKGTVRVDNQYPVEVTVRVNGTNYRVPGNTKLDVTVAAGEFTYELLSAADPVVQRATVDEKKTATLRVK